MITTKFYINTNIEKACNLSGLCLDELEYIVGRYRKNSFRANELRGELIIDTNSTIKIRHAFTKKVLWKGVYE